MLHKETVRSGLLDLAIRLFGFSAFNQFVLAGGTALALRIGHRQSEDLDFFTNERLDVEELITFLAYNGFNFVQQNRFKESLLGYTNNVKTDFIKHPYPWIDDNETMDGLRMASLADIVAMKLNAIVGSGSRLKDFVDIAFLSGYYALSEMLHFYKAKYPGVNDMMVLKSLCYFDDIDFNVKLVLTKSSFNWELVKRRILEMVKLPDVRFPSL